jgi:hypothetical protein
MASGGRLVSHFRTAALPHFHIKSPLVDNYPLALRFFPPIFILELVNNKLTRPNVIS